MSRRRSLARPQEGPPTGEEVDRSEELRLRRSFVQTPLQPFAQRENLTSRRVSVVPGATNVPSCNPSVFFNCLKLAAENKINAKNAFHLAMIDYLSEAVQSRESPLNNFQLAGCSLDAGTKIYAARVDHVAGNVAEFAMSLSMMHKKGGQNADAQDDNMGDEGDDEKKKKSQKKKKRVKSTVLARDVSENTLDMSKMVPRNKLFPIVGNMMDESLDSFTFTERSCNGAVPEMKHANLEDITGHAPVKISLPKLPERPQSLIPSLSDFKFKRPTMTSTVRTKRNSVHPSSPRKSMRRLTLTRDNFDFDDAGAFGDDAPPFDDSTIIEEIAACNQRPMEHVGGIDDDDDLFTAQLPTLHPSMYYLNDKDNLPRLYGPDYWKYRKPATRVANPAAPSTQCKAVEILPIDFDAEVDTTKLEASRAKTCLSRETMLRWNKDRYLLPCETDDEMLNINSEEFNMLDVGLCHPLRIPDPRQPRGHHMDKTPSNTVPFDYDNENDAQNYCPYPQEKMDADGDDDDDYDADDLLDNGEDFNNLFGGSIAQGNTSANNDMFRESMLVPLPANAVNTVAPVWKVARGVNMRQLEALLWKDMVGEPGVEGGDKENASSSQEEGETSDKTWLFTDLRAHLPDKIKDNCSVTTQFYALLNLANKKGLEIVSNDKLNNLKIRCIREKKDKQKPRTHPALLGL